MLNSRGNNYVASILNNDEMMSDGDNEVMIRGHDLTTGSQVAHRAGYSKGSGVMRRDVNGHPMMGGNDLDAGAEDDYQSMHDNRESQNQSRLEHVRGDREEGNGSIPSNDVPDSTSRNQGGIIQGNHNSGGMVDSYEIYGENNVDDSELDLEEEIISYSN